ncbi:hypothetical protein TcasGA2_TC031892 [Tribolium castaneum]|uniref:Uncharacterized protein n=1 Tax=Tribolium castaneum TaxID=7070 RepID=A0A139W932_TRICA|nr:hypothetical protein TcasGA2_TC031892 [Tribolium castaneum]
MNLYKDISDGHLEHRTGNDISHKKFCCESNYIVVIIFH